MRLLTAVALMLLAISTGFAQRSNTFPLTIKVADMTGARIPNATVSISPASAAASNAPKSTVLKTGHRGTVTANLKSGRYNVSIAASGFTTTWYQQIRIQRALSLTIILRVGPTGSGSPVVPGPLPVHTNSVPLHQLISAQTPERVPVTLQELDVTGAPVPYAETLLIPSPSTPVRVTVRVADESGAVLPRAKVSITPFAANPSDKPNSAVLETSPRGIVTADLEPGTYTISIAAPGFKPTWYQHVRLYKSLSLAVTLHIADYYGPTQVIEVDRLQTTNVQLRELIPEKPTR